MVGFRDREDSTTRARRLLDYLSAQGEFDRGDLGGIRLWLQNLDSDQELSDEQWRPIADQLRKQGEVDLANAVYDRIERAADDVLRDVATVLAERQELTSPWVVLVGAGGSKPEPTNIPLVSELLPLLWERASNVNAKHLLQLQEQCERLGIRNIEDLLTALDLARTAAGNPRLRQLVESLLGSTDVVRGRPTNTARVGDPGLTERLSETTQTLFSLLIGVMRNALPNDFHRSLATRATGDDFSIITTNYDVCIERALSGVNPYYYSGVSESTVGTPILKLHGSLNWFACSSCDEVVAASLDNINQLVSMRLFPVVSQCPECASLAPHLIVPPVGVKLAEHPTLLEIRQASEVALKAAKVIAVAGYSFSEADEYVLKMISRAVADSERRILVFDQSREPSRRLAAFLKAHARGYRAAEYVTPIVGDVNQLFPEFVEAWTTARAG